jgi:hypothetical protein
LILIIDITITYYYYYAIIRWHYYFIIDIDYWYYWLLIIDIIIDYWLHILIIIIDYCHWLRCDAAMTMIHYWCHFRRQIRHIIIILLIIIDIIDYWLLLLLIHYWYYYWYWYITPLMPLLISLRRHYAMPLRQLTLLLISFSPLFHYYIIDITPLLRHYWLRHWHYWHYHWLAIAIIALRHYWCHIDIIADIDTLIDTID